MEEKANAEQHRRLEVNLSSPHGCQPVEDLDAGRDGDGHRRQHEERVRVRAHAHGEHVMRPDAHADETDGQRGGHHDRIAENRLAGKYRNDFGNEGKGGDHQNVDFRMAEDPEEVHPQYGGASGLRVEEVRSQVAIEAEHDLRGRQRADGDQDQTGHHEIHPDQQRHFPELHPRTPQAQNRGHHIDRSADAADAGNQHRQDPEVGAVPARKCLRSQRRVGEPSHVGSVSRAVKAIGPHQAEIEEKASKCGHPEAERIQARERHVARADHQREQIIGEAEHDGHGNEENHRGPMHGEHPVEDLGRDEMVVRDDELNPHDRGFDSADHEKHQGIKNVHDAQPLVIDGSDPPVKPVHQGRGATWRVPAVPLIQSTSGMFLQAVTEVSPDRLPRRLFPDRSSPSPASCIQVSRRPGFESTAGDFRVYSALLRKRWCPGSSGGSGPGRSVHGPPCLPRYGS